MRIKSLDSLRGIAALTVVISHLVITPLLVGSGVLLGQEFHILSKDAVLVFFILSGFVLFLSLNDSKNFDYCGYAIKRAARIYIPFIAAVIASATLMIATSPQPIPQLSLWFNEDSWFIPASLQLVGYHLLMTDYQPWQSLDNVMWSLVHEIRISAIFPLIAFCVRLNWKITVAVCFIISVISLGVHTRWTFWPIDPVSTLRYLIFFAGGAAMALHLEELRAWFARRSVFARITGWSLTVALLACPCKQFENLTTASGAIFLVLLCFADRKTDWHLSKPLPLWLGKVSYSLYLVHLPILLTITHLLYGRLPLIGILVLALTLSLVAAEMFYRSVEIWAIRSGRKLARFTGICLRWRKA